ncbi:MAG: hypothetical protein HY696_07575 [Deltaproteobacteria bacterium]|nr:hypothetical protein [Deltaproteobacteria bacterium]
MTDHAQLSRTMWRSGWRNIGQVIGFSLPLLVLGIFFGLGHDYTAKHGISAELHGAPLHEKIWPKFRLYFSRHEDELLYYEYASLMLGAGAPHRTHYAPNILLHRIPTTGTPAWPYRDFHYEYPPLALLPMLLPRLFTADPQRYHDLFALEMIALLYIAIGLAARMRRGYGDRVSLPRLATYGGVAAAAVGQLTTQRFDLFPATLLLAGLAAWQRARVVAATGWITSGALAKIFPGIVFPATLLAAWQHRRAEIPRLLAIAAMLTLACFLPLVWWAPGGIGALFGHHTGRGLQIECIYSVGLALWDFVHPIGLWTRDAAGSRVLGGAWPDAVAHYTMPTLLVLTGIITWWFARRRLPPSDARWPCAWLLLLATFVFASPIGSPQFVLWFLPLTLAVPGTAGHAVRRAFLYYAAATQAEYFFFYGKFHALKPLGVLGECVRWAGFGYVVVTLFRGMTAANPALATTTRGPRHSA